jgi:K+/H+ antiporter YhaU regulatory subunit KhtT
VYLTNYCRRLRPAAQIIAQSRLDRNVTTLHRAGADSVLSYASTGANALWNRLTAENTLQLAEGLEVFRVAVPREVVGKPLAKAGIPESTGCTVVAVASGGSFQANPPADQPLPAGAMLVLIGDDAS